MGAPDKAVTAPSNFPDRPYYLNDKPCGVTQPASSHSARGATPRLAAAAAAPLAAVASRKGLHHA